MSFQSVRTVHRRVGPAGACADNLALPVRSAVADLVVSDGVIHHTSDPRTSFLENARVVRPGGLLYLTVYRPSGHYPILYRCLGPTVRALVRRRPGRWLVHGTLVPAYRLARRLKSGSWTGWRGTVNLFYDYLVTPRASFHRRSDVERWASDAGLVLRSYDPNPGGNVHVFVFAKHAARGTPGTTPHEGAGGGR
jgi:SAM-dependent methyltransferase